MSKETIIQVLKSANAPLKSGEIAEKAGVDKKEVTKIINLLKKEGVIESPKRCYYSIKK